LQLGWTDFARAEETGQGKHGHENHGGGGKRGENGGGDSPVSSVHVRSPG
jgi:hypothetical protein